MAVNMVEVMAVELAIRKELMKTFLIIFFINLLIFILLFIYCACKVASIADREMEELKKDDKS